MSSVGFPKSSPVRMTTNFDVGTQDNILYGVGIEFESEAVSGGQVLVKSLTPGYSAQRSGQISIYDEIVEIDDQEVQCDLTRAKVLILGRQGSFATIVVCSVDGQNMRSRKVMLMRGSAEFISMYERLTHLERTNAQMALDRDVSIPPSQLELMADNAAQRQEINDLQNKLAKFEKGAKSDILLAENDRLRREFERARREPQSPETDGQLQKLYEENRRLTHSLETAKSDLNAANDKCRRLQERNRVIEQELELLQQPVNASTPPRRSTNSPLKTPDRSFEQTSLHAMRLESELEAARADMVALQAMKKSYNALEKEHANLQNRLRLAERKAEALEKSPQSIEAHEALRNENRELLKKLGAAELQVKEKQDELHALQRQLNQRTAGSIQQIRHASPPPLLQSQKPQQKQQQQSMQEQLQQGSMQQSPQREVSPGFVPGPGEQAHMHEQFMQYPPAQPGTRYKKKISFMSWLFGSKNDAPDVNRYPSQSATASPYVTQQHQQQLYESNRSVNNYNAPLHQSQQSINLYQTNPGTNQRSHGLPVQTVQSSPQLQPNPSAGAPPLYAPQNTQLIQAPLVQSYGGLQNQVYASQGGFQTPQKHVINSAPQYGTPQRLPSMSPNPRAI